MMVLAADLLSLSIAIAFPVLALSFALTALRVIRGPTLPDRVVALDMLTAIAIGFIALVALSTGFHLFIDIAISLGLVGFLATIAFARFVLVTRSQAAARGTAPPAGPSAGETP